MNYFFFLQQMENKWSSNLQSVCMKKQLDNNKACVFVLNQNGRSLCFRMNKRKPSAVMKRHPPVWQRCTGVTFQDKTMCDSGMILKAFPGKLDAVRDQRYGLSLSHAAYPFIGSMPQQYQSDGRD